MQVRVLSGVPKFDCSLVEKVRHRDRSNRLPLLIVLEFDHRDGEVKDESVSVLVGYGVARKVKAEVEKCEVRCSNCHRKRTAIQQGYYWVDFLKEKKLCSRRPTG